MIQTLLLWSSQEEKKEKMSAKYSSTLSEDSAHQIGCISIYKLFNRHSFPAGQRGGKVFSDSSYSSVCNASRPAKKGGSSMRNIDSETRSHALVLPRSSYDECGSRGVAKIEETPRLSLDSRISESKKASLHLQMEDEKTIKQQRSNIIAKLMGLEAFPSKTESSTTAASKNRDDSPITPRVRAQQASSSSVYGDIEKMITDIEFRRSSNKDHAALLQILESTQKANQRQENQGGKFRQRRQNSENRCLNHLSESEKPESAVRRTCYLKGDKNKQYLKDQRENNLSISIRRKAKNSTPKNNSHKEITGNSSMDKNSSTLRNLERERTSSGMSSPKLCSKLPPTTSSCNSKTVEMATRRKKRHSKSANLKEHSIDARYSTSQADADSVKSESDNSDASMMETEVRSFFPNSIITNIREQNSSRSNSPSVEHGTNIMEQTSPVSVLDNTFYDEDPPSPPASMPTPFRGKNHNCLEESEETEKWKHAEKKGAKDLNQQGKIVLDMANEILIRKNTMGGLYTSRRKTTGLETIMKEISSEISHRCNTTSYWKTEDEGDDGMIKLLTADMKYQSEDWNDFTGEVPYLVLDVERWIFKDLINEVVTG